MSRILTFQGDLHGDLHAAKRATIQGEQIIQLGDLGIGFAANWLVESKISNRNDYWFIRGNHDNPDLCRTNPRYLGEFGYDEALGIFYISGARSVDRYKRIEGVDWWRDEELTAKQQNECFDLFVKLRPKIVVSHDSPVTGLKKRYIEYDGTKRFLEALYAAHQPRHWFYGHHHVNFTKRHKSTYFTCVGEKSTHSILCSDP